MTAPGWRRIRAEPDYGSRAVAPDGGRADPGRVEEGGCVVGLLLDGGAAEVVGPWAAREGAAVVGKDGELVVRRLTTRAYSAALPRLRV